MSKYDIVGHEGDHASLPPSGSDRWINCGGSIRESQGAGPEHMPEAMLGTAAHSLASNCLEDNEEPVIHQDKLTIMVQDNKFVETFRVDDNMVDAVTIYTDYCRSLMDKAAKFIEGVEHKVNLHWLHPNLHGTLDFSCYDVKAKILHIVDYKHGEGVSVSPILNSQLMIYAIGEISELKNRGIIKQQAWKEISVIRLTIVQPRDRNSSKMIRTWDISYQDLEQWMFNILTPAAIRTDDPNALLLAGPWCTWCKAGANCPARNQLATQILGASPDNPNLPAPHNESPERIGKMLHFLEQLGGWRKRLDAHAQGMLERGQKIPGYKLVKRRSNRKWRPEAEAELAKMFGQNAYIPKLITITQAEKLAKNTSAADQIGGFMIKPDTGNTIAPATSDTPEVKVKPLYLEFIDSSPMFE